jgi:hypothetical protein
MEWTPRGLSAAGLQDATRQRAGRAVNASIVAAGMTQVEAARVVGLSVTWVNSIVHTSEEAREYLEASRARIVAKHRLLAEASINEYLKAMFAEELGLSKEERGKLAVSRTAAIQAGLSPTVLRAAGLLGEPAPQHLPATSVRVNVNRHAEGPGRRSTILEDCERGRGAWTPRQAGGAVWQRWLAPAGTPRTTVMMRQRQRRGDAKGAQPRLSPFPCRGRAKRLRGARQGGRSIVSHSPVGRF